ncbi:hypothetical protein [Methylobacterium sp. NEAU K]|uniref:hypothetical protein n=1 Tax=Methylobacterium sp. NEAU K TaxID=3064946 RepID=UPI002736AD6B|nr:hypothetical protein [Methylobacterium sp. NEAU K]MDP4005980.1 hypothetical protein [Methylobacterium sp. NEAU K]
MRKAALGAVIALLLSQSAIYAQDIIGLDAPDSPSSGAQSDVEMRARVAAEFPDTLLIRFRNVRRITSEAGHEVEFCGQVSAMDPGRPEPNYQVFLYERTGTTENVRILGADALNGFRIGRKMIGALKRVGCL